MVLLGSQQSSQSPCKVTYILGELRTRLRSFHCWKRLLYCLTFFSLSPKRTKKLSHKMHLNQLLLHF